MSARQGNRRLRRGWVPLALASCALLLLPAGSGARIVPQKGIAKINLNMTRAQVVRAKGKPGRERIVRHEIIGRQRMLRYGKTRVFFGGTHRRARVVTVTTRDRRQRTRSRIGVGSREAAVQRRIAGVSCQTEFGIRACSKGEFRPGERVTAFNISDAGRVTDVVISFVID